ncbi:cytochrome c biogenesis protein/redoxin [Proteiniborus sp. MB09-C3]|uniref:cytochrome c biogenesis protein/redoxin n=1 Tax=Proteiniborus sp. MB09-C3 TaxID=3050072 RepID=UPI002552E8C7|nr:cytochrome c biogenesis protein/redoxin [Proteiniborus sp. MB09-C3]WIV13748.1 cytochrome c biogenesis protein/redoxin [Proteiniborus sp. MB09-C3]
MFNSLISTNSISFILVFLEGFLSFFSPCIIPLIPIYMGYLAGNTDDIGEDGSISYNRRKVLFHTIFFVLGISFAFFILGMSFTAVGSFFQNNQLLFTRLAGILIIVLGLFQLGVFELSFLHRDRRFNYNLSQKKTNPLVAFIMGFTFSFAWTPCVGPALSSVLILASSASSSLVGNLLVFLYAIGFIIPFMILGLFTTQALNFLDKHQKLLKHTVKAGGVILIIMGIMTFTGWMNGISGYLNSFVSTESNGTHQEDLNDDLDSSSVDNNKQTEDENSSDPKIIPAFDFTLTDQYGSNHTLSDYKGKVIFLNFWATWCPPCRKEMPDIQALYDEYNQNQDDVVFLGVANPRSEYNLNTRETDKEGITTFLEDNELNFPVVFDESGEIFSIYGISSLPTTFLIDKEGNIIGYAPGMLTKDIMKSVIEQALDTKD